MKQQGWGRIINISGANARNAGNLSGGARNGALVHLTKTLAVQMGRHGITVNCIHPGTTRTERTPSLLATRAAQLGISPEEAEQRDFAPDSPRGNSICRMVDAAEVAIRDLIRAREPKRVKIEDIQKLVASHYSVTRADILSSRRTAIVVKPRQVAMYLAKALTLRSLPEIGRRFGGRDHTTVLHAVRKIEGLCSGDSALREELELLKRMLQD